MVGGVHPEGSGLFCCGAEGLLGELKCRLVRGRRGGFAEERVGVGARGVVGGFVEVALVAGRGWSSLGSWERGCYRLWGGSEVGPGNVQRRAGFVQQPWL